jgi:hypothetical protein
MIMPEIATKPYKALLEEHGFVFHGVCPVCGTRKEKFKNPKLRGIEVIVMPNAKRFMIKNTRLDRRLYNDHLSLLEARLKALKP